MRRACRRLARTQQSELGGAGGLPAAIAPHLAVLDAVAGGLVAVEAKDGDQGGGKLHLEGAYASGRFWTVLDRSRKRFASLC